MEVQIPRHVYQKIMHWVNKTDLEVSGFGKVTWHKEVNVFEVTDVWLLKQEVGSAHTDIDEVSLARLMYQTREMPGDLRFWWHSHVNMDVFWSGTDTNTIKKLGSAGWIVASVFNKKHQIRSALGYKTESIIIGNETLIKDELPTFIIDPAPSQAEVEEWDKAFDDNVQQRRYTPTYETTGLGKQWDTKPRQASLLETPYSDDYWMENFGLIGYGAQEEARALGVSKKVYLEQISSNNYNTVTALEKELYELQSKGKFYGRPNNFNR